MSGGIQSDCPKEAASNVGSNKCLACYGHLMPTQQSMPPLPNLLAAPSPPLMQTSCKTTTHQQRQKQQSFHILTSYILLGSPIAAIPVKPFSKEDQECSKNLYSLYKSSSESIPHNSKIITSLVHAALTGKKMLYDDIFSAYQNSIQRILTFCTHLNTILQYIYQ